MEPKHYVNINTIGQTLGRKSYEIRPEPANPINIVSPWTANSDWPKWTGSTTITADDLLPTTDFDFVGNNNDDGPPLPPPQLPATITEIWSDDIPLPAGDPRGINRVGQVLGDGCPKNVTGPQIAQFQTSPWLQSSYGPDLLRRPLDLNLELLEDA